MRRLLFFLIMFSFFLTLSFAVPFGYATVTGSHNGGGGASGIPYPEQPSFSFSPIPVPSFSINWSLNPIQDIENIISAIPSFVGGYIAANLANFFLYVLEAIYYFFAYAEYFIVITAVQAASGLGVWSLPVFVGVFVLLVSLVIMLIKVSEGALLLGGA